MKTNQTILFLALVIPLSLGSACAQTGAVTNESVDDSMRLEPTEADISKARADREKRAANASDVFVSTRGTVIRKNVDQNNRMKSITVTPTETGVPYTMKNQAQNPVPNGPGSDTHSTLGTPKFIEFTW